MVSCGRRETDVDGGWAWVVLVASFVCSGIACGHVVNSAIYFVTFVEAFEQSRSYTAWIITVQGVALHTAGPLSSLVLAKFGPRVTMMSGGVISSLAMAGAYFAGSVIEMAVVFAINGVGVAFLLTSSLAPMAIYFHKHFYVATGVTNSGAGFGVIFMGLQLEWSMDAFGWRGAMLVQSGIMLQALVCGSLVFDVVGPPSASGQPPARAALDPSLFRDVRLQLLFLSFFLYFFYYNVLLLIMKDDFQGHGFGAPYEAVILGLGLSNTAGRLTAGFFSEYLLVPPLQLFVASSVATAALLALIFVRQEWTYFLCFVLVGFANGQQVVLQNLSLAYVFGRPLMQVLWGFGIFLGTLAYVGGSPMAGYLMDLSGSYGGVFLMTATGSFLCGLLNAVCYWIHRRRLTTDKAAAVATGEREPLKPASEEAADR